MCWTNCRPKYRHIFCIVIIRCCTGKYSLLIYFPMQASNVLISLLSYSLIVYLIAAPDVLLMKSLDDISERYLAPFNPEIIDYSNVETVESFFSRVLKLYNFSSCCVVCIKDNKVDNLDCLRLRKNLYIKRSFEFSSLLESAAAEYGLSDTR